MKLTKILLLTSIGIILSGCSSTSIKMPEMNYFSKKDNSRTIHLKRYSDTELSNKEYVKNISRVGLLTKKDSNYKRINLNTPENKTWFRNVTFALWNRDISKTQFKQFAIQKYPSRSYEFSFIIENL